MELTLPNVLKGFYFLTLTKNPKYSLCFGHFENNFHPNLQKCLSKPKRSQNTINTLDFLLKLKSKIPLTCWVRVNSIHFPPIWKVFVKKMKHGCKKVHHAPNQASPAPLYLDQYVKCLGFSLINIDLSKMEIYLVIIMNVVAIKQSK